MAQRTVYTCDSCGEEYTLNRHPLVVEVKTPYISAMACRLTLTRDTPCDLCIYCQIDAVMALDDREKIKEAAE